MYKKNNQVLQASHYAKSGEIFVLDMGDPVRIDDMARNLIRLYGFKPDVDIPIVYTGLCPGEKLYEELLMNEESMKNTWFEKMLRKLDEAVCQETDKMKAMVAEIVPTYHAEL